MRDTRRVPWLSMIAVCALAGASLPASAAAWDDTGAPAAGAGLTDEGQGQADQAAQPGPVRMARFSVVDGDVTWRPAADGEWSGADVNLPLRQGAQISVADHGRAEVQFDDGSELRLGNGAEVTIQTLYSDADGEFTEIKLTNGLATMRLKNNIDIYQIDTPFVAAKATGPGRIRFGVSDSEEIAVKHGDVKIEGPHGAVTLHAGDFLGMQDPNAQYDVTTIPGDDSWEEWNDSRDAYIDGDTPTKHNAPANIAIASPDLDDYGAWHDVSGYGNVWCPRVAADWRPYSVGHWVWCDPFGWTWVSSEPWGWAPYHYGTWFHCAYGWAWRPGPVYQYWSPAVVNFYDCGGSVCWVPLAPAEVVYPTTLACGFVGGSWSLFFSIGGCAVYYPHGPQFCYARAWGNGWVNRWDWHHEGVGGVELVHVAGDRAEGFAFAANHNTMVADAQFRPANLRYSGASMATYLEFRAGGASIPVAASRSAEVLAGRAVTAPASGVVPSAGPARIAPTHLSTSPSRSFVSAPAQGAASRPVYRAALSPAIARETGQPNAVRATRVSNPSDFGGQVRSSTQPSGAGGTASGGRQLSASEQAAIQARGSLGFTPRVRYEGDSNGVDSTGHAYSGNGSSTKGSGNAGTSTRAGNGNTTSQGNRSGSSSTPRRTYSVQDRYSRNRSSNGSSSGSHSSSGSNGGKQSGNNH